MSIRMMVAHIKRRETRVARTLVRLAKIVQRAELPAPRAVFAPLYTLHTGTASLARSALQRIYFQPMFRARCEACGGGLILQAGLPYVYGDLRLRLGRNCKINGHTALAAGSIFQSPTLTIGDETNLSFGTVISVAQSVTLGSHVRVAEGCYICDNPGHPVDAERRRAGAPVDRSQVRPVVIEDDVWLGTRAVVLPGVRIGRGSIIGAGSVVSRDIPPYCLAVGNPAVVVKRYPNAESGERAGSLEDAQKGVFRGDHVL